MSSLPPGSLLLLGALLVPLLKGRVRSAYLLALPVLSFVHLILLPQGEYLRFELFDYVLTPMGRDLSASIVALTQWGDRWAGAGEPPILYTHAQCGAAVESHNVCTRCGAHDPDDVQARPGPGMPEGYVAARRRGRSA